MGYPVGPLLAALADRILHNLDLIEAKAPKWGTPEQDQPPYSDTQLLISLLGVLIFPHEKAPGALGELMRGYKSLRNVLNVVYSQRADAGIEIADADGDAVIIDPAQLTDLPRLLRNSVAHFNILPLDKDGRFSGIRIWNRRDSDKQITFVADIDFDEMRSLARYVLGELRKARTDLPLQDPENPMIEVESQRKNPGSLPVKVPRLNPDIWRHLVDVHDGNAGAAKTTLDRLVKGEADRLRMAKAEQKLRRAEIQRQSPERGDKRATDGVQDGGMALTVYLEAIHPQTASERKDEIRRQLLDYCNLDTYALVRLWQHFTGRNDIRIYLSSSSTR